MNKADLGRQAVLAASRLRSEHKIKPSDGLCPYDIAQKMGIKVQFLQIPSLEGMYSPAPKQAIVLGSERPAGRRRYTCSHEIGHHVFNHGTRLDELGSETSSESPEEYIAQRFAGALLMPKLAISSAVNKRKWDINKLTAEQAFKLAGEFGVGFVTFLTHLAFSFETIQRSHLENLKKISPKDLRSKLVGFEIQGDLYFVDQNWCKESVDLETGDILISVDGITIQGSNLELRTSPFTHYVAAKQGQGRIQFSACSRIIKSRVVNRGFVGLAKYQYLEEAEDD